jgi:glutathione S-transferase
VKFEGNQMLEKLVPLVVILNVALLIWAMMMVGNARRVSGIKAPATSGHPVLDRAFRVHMNLIEQSIMFLPALWLCKDFFSARWAVIFGLTWVVGRIWFALGYYQDAAKRSSGFLLSIAAFSAMFLCGAYGYIAATFL